MYGFLMMLGLLLANVLGCGITFFAGSTGLIVPLAVTFFVLYGLTAFRAGRGVEFRSPLAPRAAVSRPGAAAQPTKRRTPRPVAPADDFGILE